MTAPRFRVWDKHNKQWAKDFTLSLDGELLCDNGATMFIRDNFVLIEDKEMQSHPCFCVNPACIDVGKCLGGHRGLRDTSQDILLPRALTPEQEQSYVDWFMNKKEKPMTQSDDEYVSAVTRTSVKLMIKKFDAKDLHDVLIYVMHIYNNKYATFAEQDEY